MTKVYTRKTDFIYWHRGLLDIAGLWPLEPRGIKFYAFLVYTTVHLCGNFADLVQIFGDFRPMVENLGETGLLIMVIAKIPAMKCSSLLRKVVREIVADNREDGGDGCESFAERKMYISYSSKSLRLFKMSLRVGWVATGAFYVKTIVYFVIAEILGSGTRIYAMPYHVYFFINITDIHVYMLVYAYQGPMIYVITCHGIISCFMWSLIIHVCGQLSILAFSIKHVMATGSEKSDEHIEYAFRRIIQKHNKLIRTSKALERIFRIFLLDEIAICAVVVGLCMYSILVMDSVLSDVLLLFCYIMFMFGMLMVTYGWCLVGDILRQESLNVLDAFYECEWYSMSPRCQKLIIICMIRARYPLYISGGGFYVFTLTSFTGVVKSALAYASMLRQVG